MYETFKDKLHFYVVFECGSQKDTIQMNSRRLCEGLRVFDYIMESEAHTEQEHGISFLLSGSKGDSGCGAAGGRAAVSDFFKPLA